jgi:phenylalanyl-tRNA synthetase beta chain
MKFSLSWLKTWFDTDASLETIATTLSAIGLEVEGVENRAAVLAPFVIAEVIEAAPHPNADRLRACKVSFDGTTTLSVVCGAPNARTGMKAVFAPAGAHIPGTGITLKVGEIRGVKSEGMLVSFRELGLGEDHDGIIELPADAPVGQNYAAYAGLDDAIIEISVTPNRGDALSVRGVARDLAAAGLGTLKPFAPAAIPGSGASRITWRNDALTTCPYALGRTISGVKNGPSPEWLRKRLESVGLRPINTLVDITNFFTIDLGRPLHVFDADKVQGATLTFRAGLPGETFDGLNGKPVRVTPADCVIADATGAVSLAGIVGGESTGCDDSTTNVFLECALFDRIAITLTGQRHAIFSDARQRFERGIDSQLLPAAMDAATAMILDLCGGTASEITVAGTPPAWNRTATLRFSRIASFGGSTMTADEASASLTRLGFTVQTRTPDAVTVSVPSWRNDIAQPPALDQADLPGAAAAAEGAAIIEPEVDLLEEVLRLPGLDAITPVSLPVPPGIPAATLTPRQNRTTLARRILAARGLAECVTFSFLDHETAALFAESPETLRLANPIAADLNQMRPTPLATLAQAAARNAARGYPDLALFEIGPAYAADLSQTLVAAGIRTGNTPLSTVTRPADVFDAKADALAVLSALSVPLDAVTTTQGAAGSFYHPGQSGELRQGPKNLLATFGTLHPTLCAALDLPAGAVAFEIFLDAIPEPKRRKKSAPVLPPFQPLRRDFAFLADLTAPAEAILRAARTADRNFVTGATLFDRYTGPGIPAGKISLAVAVTIQPTDKPLTEPDLDAISAKIIAEVAKKTGATLRAG